MGVFLVWECFKCVCVFQVCVCFKCVCVFQVFTTGANLVAFPSIWKRSVLS